MRLINKPDLFARLNYYTVSRYRSFNKHKRDLAILTSSRRSEQRSMNHCHETGVYDRYSHRWQRTYCATIVNRKGRGVHRFDSLMDTSVQRDDRRLEGSQSGERTCTFRCNRRVQSLHLTLRLAVGNSRKLRGRRIMCNNARYAFSPFGRESAERRNWFCTRSSNSRAALSKDYCSKTAISSSLICKHTFSR